MNFGVVKNAIRKEQLGKRKLARIILTCFARNIYYRIHTIHTIMLTLIGY